MRVFACLRPGGLFLLEPQPWKSYRKRAALTPTIKRHFYQIRMRPPQFVDFLLSDAVGFACATPQPLALGPSAFTNHPRPHPQLNAATLHPRHVLQTYFGMTVTPHPAPSPYSSARVLEVPYGQDAPANFKRRPLVLLTKPS